jgi:hypothetical protein
VWCVTNGARIYEITIRGAASKLVQVEFDDVQLRVDSEFTYLRTGIVDQTVLFGLIRRIEDLGLVLLHVETIQPETEKVSIRHVRRNDR